jgi:hypothetical protein
MINACKTQCMQMGDTTKECVDGCVKWAEDPLLRSALESPLHSDYLLPQDYTFLKQWKALVTVYDTSSSNSSFVKDIADIFQKSLSQLSLPPEKGVFAGGAAFFAWYLNNASREQNLILHITKIAFCHLGLLGTCYGATGSLEQAYITAAVFSGAEIITSLYTKYLSSSPSKQEAGQEEAAVEKIKKPKHKKHHSPASTKTSVDDVTASFGKLSLDKQVPETIAGLTKPQQGEIIEIIEKELNPPDPIKVIQSLEKFIKSLQNSDRVSGFASIKQKIRTIVHEKCLFCSTHNDFDAIPFNRQIQTCKVCHNVHYCPDCQPRFWGTHGKTCQHHF